jgi:hypothetical protein
MNSYRVEKAFATHQIGDVIQLTQRQAQYLLVLGLLSDYEKVLLRAVTSPMTGTARHLSAKSFQATLTGSGAISATVIIEHSNDLLAWLPDETLSLSGSNSVSDGFSGSEAWAWTRARLTAITGTNAAITVTTMV